MTIKISSGDNLPHEFNVIIEISTEGSGVKYEIDKESGLLTVDRFLPVAMYYPCNYGFVPQTLAEDGDPADVLVITPYPVQPGALIKVRPIGLLCMTDEAGKDNKILTVPTTKLCQQSASIHDLHDINSVILNKISHFFEYYKSLESGKWVKIDGWLNKDAAEKELLLCVDRFNQ